MEAVILIGLQGSGKSTFYNKRFAQTHGYVSLDMQKTRAREAAAIHELIDGRRDFVVDNTNPTIKERARYIAAAKAAGYTVIGYCFDCSVAECLKRNELRAGKARIPAVGLYATRKRMQPPTRAEGFDELWVVRVQENRFECLRLSPGTDETFSARGNP